MWVRWQPSPELRYDPYSVCRGSMDGKTPRTYLIEPLLRSSLIISDIIQGLGATPKQCASLPQTYLTKPYHHHHVFCGQFRERLALTLRLKLLLLT